MAAAIIRPCRRRNQALLLLPPEFAGSSVKTSSSRWPYAVQRSAVICQALLREDAGRYRGCLSNPDHDSRNVEGFMFFYNHAPDGILQGSGCIRRYRRSIPAARDRAVIYAPGVP